MRTQGNPFFCASVLSSLHQDKLLTFDYSRGRWTWDMAQLRYANISSDVVDLLVGQIQRMDSRLQEIIKLAACIGNTFSLATLAIVAETTEEQATWELWQLAGSGMIIALHNQYDLFVLAEYFRLRQSDEHNNEPLQHASHVALQQSHLQHNHHAAPHFGHVQHEERPPSSHTHLNTNIASPAAAANTAEWSSSVAPSSSPSSLVSSLIPSFNSKTVLFRFAHDRVQQAAASLIPAAERRQVHLNIGRLLLSHTADEELDNAVIDIVQHFNTGGAHVLLTEQQEMRNVVAIEVRAGKKAKASTAYSSAVEYLTIAKELLDRLQPLPDQQHTAPNDGEALTAWHFEYELSVEVHVNLCLYLLLSSDIEGAATLTSEALKHINTVYDQVAILEVQQQIAIIRVNMIQATEIGLQSLTLLGYQLDTLEEVEALAKDSTRVYQVLERIIAAQELTDPYYLAVLRLLVNLTAPSFFHPNHVFSQIAHAMVRIASEQGINLQSGFSLSTYGHVLWGERQPALCYRFGREAMALLDRYGSAAIATRAKVQTTFYGCIALWMEPLRVTYVGCFNTADLCNSLSDFEFVGYSLLYGVSQMFGAGEQLERVLARQRELIALFTKRKQAVIYCVQGMYVSLGKIAGIIAPEADSAIVDGVLVTPAALVASFQTDKVFMFEFAQHAYTTMFHYYQRDFQRAAVSGEMGWQMFLRQGHSGASGLTLNTDLTLYYALTLLSLAPLVAETGSVLATGGGGEADDSFDSVLAEAHSSARRFDELEVLRQQIAGKSPRHASFAAPTAGSEPQRGLQTLDSAGVLRPRPASVRGRYTEQGGCHTEAHRAVGDSQSVHLRQQARPGRRGEAASVHVLPPARSADGAALRPAPLSAQAVREEHIAGSHQRSDARGGAGQRARSALLSVSGTQARGGGLPTSGLLGICKVGQSAEAAADEERVPACVRPPRGQLAVYATERHSGGHRFPHAGHTLSCTSNGSNGRNAENAECRGQCITHSAC